MMALLVRVVIDYGLRSAKSSGPCLLHLHDISLRIVVDRIQRRRHFNGSNNC
jgi:hypothetical protein